MFIQFRRFLLKKFCVQYLYRLILLISLAKNSIFCFFGAIRRQNSGQNRVPENAVKWGIPGKIKNAIFLLFAVKILVRQFEKPVNTGLGAYFPRNIYSTKILLFYTPFFRIRRSSISPLNDMVPFPLLFIILPDWIFPNHTNANIEFV